jgi:hypothetical protein
MLKKNRSMSNGRQPRVSIAFELLSDVLRKSSEQDIKCVIVVCPVRGISLQLLFNAWPVQPMYALDLWRSLLNSTKPFISKL